MAELLELLLFGPPRGRLGDRSIDLGPRRQQAVLALLALRSGSVVSSEDILDAVWGDDPPTSGAKIIPPYVYRLRRLLEQPDVIVGTRGGYRLGLEPERLDVHRFEDMLAMAKRRRTAGDLAGARTDLSHALAIGADEPLAALPGPYLAAQRGRLVERRLCALEDRIELDLRLGDHDALVAELTALVAEHPLRERFSGQLMRALAWSGRRVEALEVYAETRRALVDQLGIEPGPELRDIHVAVLRGTEQPYQPAPAYKPSPVAEESAAFELTEDLPRPPTAFTGRRDELAALLAPPRGAAPPLLAVHGLAGVGKTALALHAAGMIASEASDGQLFLDLRGHAPDRRPCPVEEALEQLLHATGVPPDQVPVALAERLSMYHDRMSGRHVVVILDDAHSVQQVRPLIPMSPTCRTIITSRRNLAGLEEARPVRLDVLPTEDATALLSALTHRSQGDDDGAEALVEWCGRLPLAIRLVAARMRHRPSWSFGSFAEVLRDHADERPGHDPELAGVRAAFAMSCDHLGPAERRIFRLLGLIPSPEFDILTAAAIADVDPAEAERLLESLLDASLLGEPRVRRFRLHDLVRTHATSLAAAEESDGARDAALSRLLDHQLGSTSAAVSGLFGQSPVQPPPTSRPRELPRLDSAERAARWLEENIDGLVAAVAHARRHGRDEASWRLGTMIASYLVRHGRPSVGQAVQGEALAAAESRGDPLALGWVRLNLGTLADVRGDHDASVEHYRIGLDAAIDTPESRRLRVHLFRRRATCQLYVGEYAAARADLLEALDLITDGAAADGCALRLTLATLHAFLERWSDAESVAERACALAKRAGHQRFVQAALRTTGSIRLDAGRPEEAVMPLRNAADSAQRLGLVGDAAFSLACLGEAHQRLGDEPAAEQAHRHAVELLGDYAEPGLHAELALRRAATYHVAEDFDAAERDYAEALALTADKEEPRDPARALLGLADCDVAAGRIARAMGRWRQVVAVCGDRDLPQAARARAELHRHVRDQRSYTRT